MGAPATGSVPPVRLSHDLFAKLAAEVECHPLIFQGATCKGERNIAPVGFRCFGANLQQFVRTSDGAKLFASIKCATDSITNEGVILCQFLIVFGVSFGIQYFSAHVIIGTGESNVDGLREFFSYLTFRESYTFLNDFGEAVLNLCDGNRLTNCESLKFTVHQIFQVGTVRNAQGSFNQLPTRTFVLTRFGECSEVGYLQFGGSLINGKGHNVRRVIFLGHRSPLRCGKGSVGLLPPFLPL